ncbi:MAG: glycosyltransferase family 2 protein [Treponema sp.]|nr:glycosyltransferase family 2 protein [Treponema sp.]
MNDPRLTVIMPTFNKEKYISQALDSVLMQETNYIYQVIVADDCSSDKTISIVKSYQQKHPNKIQLLESPKNQKLYKNILRAYEITKTDYFTVLDPDDYWTDAKKIQKALDFLEANKEFTLYLGNTEMNGEPYVQASHSYDFDFYDCLADRASFGHTSSTIFRNVIFYHGIPYKMKNLSSATQERTFRGDSFRNFIHLFEGNGHFEPFVDSVYRVTEEGIWTSLSRAEQQMLNINLYKDMYLYFGKDYPELLNKSYRMLSELKTQLPANDEIKAVEELCNSRDFQEYLNRDKHIEQNDLESNATANIVNYEKEPQTCSFGKKPMSLKRKTKEKAKRILNRIINYSFEQEQLKSVYDSSKFAEPIYSTTQHIKDEQKKTHNYVMENYWANVFKSTIADSDFLQYKSFCPGRWAASYSFLYVLYRVVNEFRPHNIIEFGLGQTSKITMQYAKKYNENLTIIEHNPDWLDAFKKNVPESFDVDSYVHILGLKEKDNGNGYAYDGFDDFLAQQKHKFDLVIVDGPFGSKHNSRPDVLKIIESNMLNGNFVIIVDDCERLGEQETIQTIQTILRRKEIKYQIGEYSGEKKQVVITNLKNRFLTSM